MLLQAFIVFFFIRFALSQPISSCSDVFKCTEASAGSWNAQIVLHPTEPLTELELHIQLQNRVKLLETDFGVIVSKNDKNFLIVTKSLGQQSDVGPLVINFTMHSDNAPIVNAIKLNKKVVCFYDAAMINSQMPSRSKRAVMASTTTDLAEAIITAADQRGKVDDFKTILDCGNSAAVKNLKGSTNTGSAEDLLKASISGKHQTVRNLLDSGASVTYRDSDQRTALIHAAINDYVGVVALLLLYGADIDAKDYRNLSGMHWATWNGHIGMVDVLLCRGANIEAKEIEGRTSLLLAGQRGDTGIAELLLTNGADIKATDLKGNTALHWATKSNHKDTVELLLQNRADFDTKQEDSRTPVMLAAMEGYSDILDLLLAKKADTEVHDYTGNTALIFASWYHRAESVILLLSHDANTEAVENEGRTALICAAQKGYTDIVNILLERGARLDAVDKSGKTALAWAIKNNHPETAEALRRVQLTTLLADTLWNN